MYVCFLGTICEILTFSFLYDKDGTWGLALAKRELDQRSCVLTALLSLLLPFAYFSTFIKDFEDELSFVIITISLLVMSALSYY